MGPDAHLPGLGVLRMLRLDSEIGITEAKELQSRIFVVGEVSP
jgi:hypothetical protein